MELKTNNMKVIGVVDSPLNWYGGKYYLRKDLLKIFPPHSEYIEVFGGAGHVALFKPLVLSLDCGTMPHINVYNDLNSGLYTFFKVISNEESYKKLKMSLYLTPYSESVWNDCVDWEDEIDEVEKARKFYIRTMQSRSNNGKSWAYARESRRNIGAVVSRWQSNIENISMCREKLSHFTIENLDFEEVIKKYDSESALFFVDPPYLPSTRVYKNGYKHEMSIEDHERLVDVLLRVKGSVVLSGYDNDVYKRLEENGFTKLLLKEVVKSSSNKNRLDNKGKEYVWINYDIPSEYIYSNILMEYFYTFNQIKHSPADIPLDIKPIKKVSKTKLVRYFKKFGIKNLPLDYVDLMHNFNGGIALELWRMVKDSL